VTARVTTTSLGAGAWYGWQWWQPAVQDEEFPLADADVQQVAPAAGDRAVVLVFPEWDASGYVTEERQIPSRGRGGEDLLGLMQVLCQGPVVSGAVSAFPEGTLALGAFFSPDDQSVVIDFSQELVTGHPGGSAAEVATLTSILRTVALNFPDTRSCTILVAGSQVQTLAGHLTMDRPFDPRRWL
jgi:spore germination protein GerM